MNDTLNRLEHDWKVAKDALVFALLNIPSTTEEKEAAIKKVCELSLLPASGWRKDIFRESVEGAKGDEVIWQDYWYEDRHRVFYFTDYLEYAQELCDDGDGRTKITSESDITMTYPEIVDVIFNYMVKNKVSGITNDW